MNILFICRHNRFRSKVAEAYFKKINKNKNIQVRSAGIFPGGYPLDKEEVRVTKKLGINLTGKPQAITTKLLRWKNIIVAVTDDLPKGLFNYSSYKNKVIEWKIQDVLENDNSAKIEKIVREIMNRVENLVKKLENTK